MCEPKPVPGPTTSLLSRTGAPHTSDTTRPTRRHETRTADLTTSLDRTLTPKPCVPYLRRETGVGESGKQKILESSLESLDLRGGLTGLGPRPHTHPRVRPGVLEDLVKVLKRPLT